MSDTLEILRGALQDSHIHLSDDELRRLARTVDRQESDEPPTITVYTELLRDLAEWSARVDEGSITHNDFVDLQRIGPRIIKARDEGRYTSAEYHSLMATFGYIVEGARSLLGIGDAPT